MTTIDAPSGLVRPATIDEAAVIALLLVEAFAEFRSFYTPDAFAATTVTEEQIRERWGEGPVWVALLDEEIVGTVAAVADARGLYIRSMAMLPAAQGRGLGLMLLREVERYARESGIDLLYLRTALVLERAVQLYTSFGFRDVTEPVSLHGTPLVTMEKHLP